MNESLSEELPEMCVAVLKPGDILIGIRRGVSGYFQMYDGMVQGEAAKIVADRMNKALNVTPRQREAMLVGSMMGWACPGARPCSDLHENAAPYTTEAAP